MTRRKSTLASLCGKPKSYKRLPTMKKWEVLGVVSQGQKTWKSLSSFLGNEEAVQKTKPLVDRMLEVVPIFHPEFGRFMLEATPGAPFNLTWKDLLSVEKNMKLRCVTSSFTDGWNRWFTDVVGRQESHRKTAYDSYRGSYYFAFLSNARGKRSVHTSTVHCRWA